MSKERRTCLIILRCRYRSQRFLGFLSEAESRLRCGKDDILRASLVPCYAFILYASSSSSFSVVLHWEASWRLGSFSINLDLQLLLVVDLHSNPLALMSSLVLVQLKPSSHRRRRRDETVELRRVGLLHMNSQLAHDDCRRIQRCERSRRP